MTEQFCKNCGKPIVVMIQKNTGFCTPRCEETYEEAERYEGTECSCSPGYDCGADE